MPRYARKKSESIEDDKHLLGPEMRQIENRPRIGGVFQSGADIVF